MDSSKGDRLKDTILFDRNSDVSFYSLFYFYSKLGGGRSVFTVVIVV